MTEQPPFRAEHIGSMLRPASLAEARKQREAGTLAADEVQRIEDQAIEDVIALQEDIGLHAITDGEFRRHVYFGHFGQAVDGLSQMVGSVSFQDSSGQPVAYRTDIVDGRLRRVRGIAVGEFDFVHAHTRHTPKVTLPSPPGMHLFRFREGISDVVYPDLEEFFDDLARVFREELHDLAAHGATYVQLDDVAFAALCDPARRADASARGYDPDWLIERYVQLTNDALADRPAGMTVGMHICRGNNQGRWISEGGYDYVAERLFQGAEIDAYFLEYDSARAGGFEPLQHMPDDAHVVLGLISTKSPVMESRDELVRRIEEASQYVPLSRLALSPQCGFASVEEGNPVTPDDQRRKLELVVEIAASVWS